MKVGVTNSCKPAEFIAITRIIRQATLLADIAQQAFAIRRVAAIDRCQAQGVASARAA